MTYTPRPIDTSSVQLPPTLTDLTERLAENAHDMWAVQRTRDGWTHGPRRDDAAKLHPCLVPYEELPEAEKEYDRAASLGTLKAINALGYAIVPSRASGHLPAATAGEITRDESESVAELERHLVARAADPTRRARSDFDMDDGPDASALAPFPELAETLRWLAAHVAQPWREADAAALQHQTRHGHLARIAIASGTSAVIMAVLQLALKLSWPGLSGTALAIEVAAAAAGAVAVGVGIWVRWNTKWLAHRQLAERLRMLKFTALGRLDLLSTSAAAWRDWVEEELEQLRAPQTTDGLREWASSDTPEVERPVPSAGLGDPATATALAAYYTHKRLVYQAEYFTQKAEMARARSVWHHHLRFPLFVVTLVCVMVHVLALT